MSSFYSVDFSASTADWCTVLTIVKYNLDILVFGVGCPRVQLFGVHLLCSPEILYCTVFSAELFGLDVSTCTSVVRCQVFVQSYLRVELGRGGGVESIFVDSIMEYGYYIDNKIFR